MGYAHDLPILTLVATGLHREGMLSDRFEWFAQEVELKPDFVTTGQFHQAFKDWLNRVDERKRTPKRTRIDPSELRMADVIMALTPKQLWGLIATAIAAIMAVAGIAFELGTYLKK